MTRRSGALVQPSLVTQAARLLFGMAAGCVFLLSQFWNELDVEVGPPTFMWMALLFMALHIGFVFRVSSVFDPVVWIPIAMMMFYFGTPIAFEILGAPGSPDSDALGRWLAGNTDRGYCVALLTLLGFLLGVHLRGLVPLDRQSADAWQTDSSILLPGLVVLAIGIVMVALGIVLIGPSVMFGSYDDVWMQKAQGTDFRLLNVGLMNTRAGILAAIATHTARKRFLTWTTLGLAVVILVLSVLTGDRSTLVSFAMALGWVFSQRVRRVPAGLVATAAVVCLISLPIIGEYRRTRSVELERAERPVSELLTMLFRETGTTAQTFAHTLDQIPDEKEYAYGLTYLRALGHLIPNVGLEAGKSFLPEPEEYDPDYWLGLTIAPDRVTSTGAFGYSLGAEFYFNFGLPGVLLGTMLVGYLTAHFRNRARQSPLSLLWSALFFAMIVIAVRNIISFPLKEAVWPFAGILILRWVLAIAYSVGRRLPSAAPIARA